MKVEPNLRVNRFIHTQVHKQIFYFVMYGSYFLRFKSQVTSIHTSFSGSHFLNNSSNRCLSEAEILLPDSQLFNFYLRFI